jgi:hypothetical protein
MRWQLRQLRRDHRQLTFVEVAALEVESDW